MKRRSAAVTAILLAAAATVLTAVCAAADGETVRFSVATAAPHNRSLEFAAYVPAFTGDPAEYRVMVLFGGRNWPGAQTLEAYDFHGLADAARLVLLSPSFRDDDYWEPEAWSGQALEEAISHLADTYGIHTSDGRFYYGYSAGGQCANLFYHYAQDKVAAWGAHACGVWHTPEAPRAMALVSCGYRDNQRWELSLGFISAYREAGGELLWFGLTGADHELAPEVLALARRFFAFAASGKTAAYYADDACRTAFPAGSPEAKRLDPAYRNPVGDDAILAIWQEQR